MRFVSVRASAAMPCALAAATSSFTLGTPAWKEYSEWVWRWMKFMFMFFHYYYYKSWDVSPSRGARPFASYLGSVSFRARLSPRCRTAPRAFGRGRPAIRSCSPSSPPNARQLKSILSISHLAPICLKTCKKLGRMQNKTDRPTNLCAALGRNGGRAGARCGLTTARRAFVAGRPRPKAETGARAALGRGEKSCASAKGTPILFIILVIYPL